MRAPRRVRVVVTGLGVVTPLGNDPDCFRQALLAGTSAGAPITLFPPAELATRIAAQVDDSRLPWNHPDRKRAFAVCAARQAMERAQRQGTPLSQHYPAGSGAASLGLGLDLFSLPDMIRYLEHEAIPPSETFLQNPAEACLHQICREHQLSAPPLTHVSACAASTDALGTAFMTIRRGQRSWMLAGGSDSMINPMGLGGFCKIKATTCRNHDPAGASRPFDRDRDGFLLGEGAAMLVLEEREQARQRGARIYAEILGYGNSLDAHKISEPDPEGQGAVLAMERALRSAALTPADIGYINAHGTSTPKNDPAETRAIRRLFGSHADQLLVSSTKSMIGHLVSASGAAEVAAVVLCAEQGWVHPTINLGNPDPACDLDYLREGPRPLPPGYILKNSFAFGGQNAALVLGPA